MRRVLFAAVIALLPTGLFAQDAEIQTVIKSQISAFGSDDFDRAFDFASPNIQRMFGSSERFGQMVTNGYPMVHRPSTFTFKELKEVSGTLFQYVLIEDKSGAAYIAEYAMIETENGWKINGVQIKKRADLGV